MRFISAKISKINIPPIGRENPYRKVLDCNTLEQMIRKSIVVYSTVEKGVATYFTTMSGVTSSQFQSPIARIDVRESCKSLCITRLDVTRTSRHDVAITLNFSDRIYKLRYIGFSRQKLESAANSNFLAGCCLLPISFSVE